MEAPWRPEAGHSHNPAGAAGGSGFGDGEPGPHPDWDALGSEPPPHRPPPRDGLDFRPLFMLLDTLRSAVPRDLQDQATALIREFLLTIRALIDWYLERLEGRPREPRVEDIPID